MNVIDRTIYESTGVAEGRASGNAGKIMLDPAGVDFLSSRSLEPPNLQWFR